MNIIFLTHPEFATHQSMPRFAKMLADGMRARGHYVWMLSPGAFFSKLPVGPAFKKWLGYIDQYFLFPFMLKRKLKVAPANTLVVVTDHALGPWIPYINKYPHLIHCHDFIAQLSAKGALKNHTTGWTGKLYQRYIQRGYSKGKYFISVSEKTKSDLHSFLETPPLLSEVVYNGLNRQFKNVDAIYARRRLIEFTGQNFSDGYFLHVGGNQWYKNRIGVIHLYDSYREINQNGLPLLLIGEQPSKQLLTIINQSKFKSDIYCISECNDEILGFAYSGASLFLFPSIEEGFGWPIIEAMASGCAVLTINKAPFTEVAGEAAIFIPEYPNVVADVKLWAELGASVMNHFIQLPSHKKDEIIKLGLDNAKRFNPKLAIDAIENIYLSIAGLHYCLPQSISVSKLSVA